MHHAYWVHPPGELRASQDNRTAPRTVVSYRRPWRIRGANEQSSLHRGLTNCIRALSERPYRDAVQTVSYQLPLVVAAVGARIGIDVDALPMDRRDAVMSAWADARLPQPSSAHTTVRVAATGDEFQSLSDLSSAVTHAAIAARRGQLWMLHAAGLAAPDGGVVILVGRSGAGKTTAVSALARSYGYVSDETIGIERDGLVHPYRKPLSIITFGERFKLQHPPRRLGLLPLPHAPLHVRRIILLDRNADEAHARLTDVPLADALSALAGQSSALASMEAPLRTMSALITQTGGVLRATYAEAHSLEPLLEQAIATSPQGASDAPSRELVTSTNVPLCTPDAAGVRYRRHRDVVDWCALPDQQIAVLTSEIDGRGTLRVLGSLASALWLASDGTPRERLLAGLSSCHAEADRAVDFTLSQLVDAGLLTIDM